MSKVVITGAAGYIGGQTLLMLRDNKHTVWGIDRRVMPSHLGGIANDVLRDDFASDRSLNWIKSRRPDAIVHCAGSSLVAPSITDPDDYYQNNVVATLKLCNWVRDHLPDTKLIYSSSAATYGNPSQGICKEADHLVPVSPYGESKAMTDMILHSYHRAYGLNYVCFRYFNACGADPQTRHGQEPGARHIVARVLESIKNQQAFTLNGTDYNTRDGTCVRDYVHVSDIARAHILALSEMIPSGVYNLGSNSGTSNREIIAAAERITGRSVNVVEGARRVGDPDTLIADANKFNRLVDWQHHDLDDMIQHAWAWYVRRN